MQKRWIVLMVLVLAIMAFMVSANAEEEAGNTVVPPALSTDQVQDVDQPDATVSTHVATPAPETTQGNEGVQETPAPDETPASTEEATDAPKSDQVEAVEATAAPEASPAPGTETESDGPQDEAADAGAEPAVENTPVAPKRRGTWIVMNVSLRDLANKPAAASMMMAKYLLARSVADGVPVSVHMMRSKGRVFSGAIASQAEWNDLMDELKAIAFNADEPTVQFKDFMNSIKDEDLNEVDLWVLAANAKSSLTLTGKMNIAKVLNDSGMMMTYLNFQQENEELKQKERWLYEQILDMQVSNFSVQPFEYEKALENPVQTAMEVFDLNLLAPKTGIVRDESTNEILWTHAGMDTLLVLTTDGSGVTVAPDDAAQTMNGAFPIVIQMDKAQYMVLLRNVAPGMYRISGNVQDLAAAYCIDGAELTMVGGSSEPMDWYLEEHRLVVSLNVPQVYSENVDLCMYVNDALVEQVPAVVSSDETGHRWEFSVTPESLEPLHISFEARVGEFAVKSPVYFVRMEDRPLELAGESAATFTYYYNVPGQDESPMRVFLADRFNNIDNQELHYQPESADYTIENNELVYRRGENAEDKAWTLQVDDGVSAPVMFTVNVAHVDFLAAVKDWRAQMDTDTYAGELGKDTLVTFDLPKECVDAYKAVYEQYQSLPQTLTEALNITATLTDQRYPNGESLAVNLSINEAGGLTGVVAVPAYTVKEDNATVTFQVKLLGYVLPEQQMVSACNISVANDVPKLADETLRMLEVKAEIKGAPDKREPLTFAVINEVREEGEIALPVPFVPAKLFVDDIHLEGLSVTIKAEPAELVRLVSVASEGTEQEIEKNEQGVWVLGADASNAPYELYILDKGVVTLTITANDGENDGADAICWTLTVSSPYDTMVLLALIGAVVLVILLIALLVLRQVKKPSFARMNSVMNMRVTTSYAPNTTYVAVPMSVYGKKETDLAKLFIACQQPPLVSMPVEVLADVTIHPGKRRSFRLVVGKRAEKLNIVVGGQAQNTQKTVVFGQDQQVNIYVDMKEELHLQISSF